jgi:AraC family transcriptional regulator, regulatory protein of adaptative response / methylated-DNA-[protein]-cysteine methyltransferase
MSERIPHSPSSDYAAVKAAIAHISDTPADRIDITGLAHALGLSERQLTELFRRWCGLSPKSFAQAVALDQAKRLLENKATMLDASYEIGLSSASRLHDLFVTHTAMPPGAWRDGGRGLNMRWGVAPSPFGLAVLVVTDYGLAGIGFAENDDIETTAADLRGRWPEAAFTQDDAELAPVAARVFDPALWYKDKPVRVVLIGTDFEVRVWETLLEIPFGRATTYGAIAEKIGKPKAARAVGAAIGKNPVSFVVPCHRVLGSTGKLTGYHWGLLRKRAILGWEAGVKAG